MPLQGRLSVERMCQLAGVSRAGFYRHLVEIEPHEEEMELRDTIQRIYLEHRRHYGYRRITAELRHRGMLVNRKRVARLMQQDNLLALAPRRYVMPTTDSRHDFEVYLNLSARMEVTAVNQLWVADIMIPSMSRPGNPYDNARCESFMKTLKQEEVYCREYQNYDDLSQHLTAFIDEYYNRQRLHSALGYRAPADFEAAAPA